MQATKQLTVRMPIDLVERIAKRGQTARFLVQAVEEKLARDERAAIEASLACLADDDEANDISGFQEGQTKVISRND